MTEEKIEPVIPPPRLRRVENLTPFSHFACDKMGPGRRFFDTVVVKGTFRLAPERLVQAEVQPPIVISDRVWDPANAARSSLRIAGEVHLAKPGADVLVTGSARTPDGKPRPRWEAAVVVQESRRTILSHTVVAHGPRSWRFRALRGWVLGEAQPVAEVPLRYETAFGGAFLDREATARDGVPRFRVHPHNPSGTGFVDEATLERERPLAAPQWELPGHPAGAPGAEIRVAGLGPVPRWWRSRLRHAGTYDEAWRAEARRCHRLGVPIDYAADFDPRFFHCAAPELRLARPLRGDEVIGLTGLVGGHEQLVTSLPGVTLVASLYPGRRPWVDERMPLDTVHVDLDAQTVSLLWRLVLDQDRGITGALIRLGEGT